MESSNKILFIILIFFIFFFNIPGVKAITIETLQSQILKLQTQIAELEKQIAKIQKPKSWCYDFLTNLKYNQEGEEVKALQIALKKEGLFKAPITGYFDLYTFKTVKLFQEKYQKEILMSSGFKKGGTGFVGPATRTKLNELYGCTKFFISSLSPQQGDTLLIKIKTNLPSEKIKGRFGQKEIIFSKFGQDLISFLGISPKEKGRYYLKIDFPKGTFLKKEIKIIKRKFPITKLVVTKELKEKGFTLSKIKESITKENLLLQRALSIFTPKFYFDQPFIYPLDKITKPGEFGAFGSIRITKSGKIGYQHLGVDLETDIGSPVYAINNGIVRFSEELTAYGKTIVIDHGLGIFSIYLHLDRFKVFEGETVKKGDIIAFSGNTGYSTAPHLHFGVKIQSVNVDPLRFIETFKKRVVK